MEALTVLRDCGKMFRGEDILIKIFAEGRVFCFSFLTVIPQFNLPLLDLLYKKEIKIMTPKICLP